MTQTESPYGYTENNPLNGTDPTGLRCWLGKNDNGSCRGSGVAKFVNDHKGEIATVVIVTAAVACGASVACGVAVVGALGPEALAVAGGMGTAGSIYYGVAGVGPAEGSRCLTASEAKTVDSLSKRIAEHQAKLDAYIANPWAYDNKGLLANAPSEAVVQSIISGRVNHLQSEIANWQNQISQILNG